MSDFDTVLERLVTDPAFKAALAADPAAALSGYQLDDDEVELLRSQVSADFGGERTVEIRTSKASMMGLLGSFGGIGMAGNAPAADPHGLIGRGVAHVPQEHFGPTVNTGLSEVPQGQSGWIGPGDMPQGQAAWIGPGEAPQAESGWIGPGDVDGGGHFGPVEDGPDIAPHFGQVEGAESGPPPGAGDEPAVGYHPHIDADGDGKWDQYTAVRHADGSVDVFEDRNHDGRIDFIGHDKNGDGLLESADYDKNFDGQTDYRLTDTNGDGWMDTRTVENGGK
jgi:hypothetical protein